MVQIEALVQGPLSVILYLHPTQNRLPRANVSVEPCQYTENKNVDKNQEWFRPTLRT